MLRGGGESEGLVARTIYDQVKYAFDRKDQELLRKQIELLGDDVAEEIVAVMRKDLGRLKDEVMEVISAAAWILEDYEFSRR